MTKVLFVSNAVQAALFDVCVRPEFEVGKKWGGKSQANLAAEWKDVEVQVAPEGHPIGRTFEAQKTNWNVNDSNWVNPEKQFRFLSKTARSANGGVELAKKTLIGNLEDLKKTFAMTSFPIPSEAGEVLLIEDQSTKAA